MNQAAIRNTNTAAGVAFEFRRTYLPAYLNERFGLLLDAAISQMQRTENGEIVNHEETCRVDYYST